jgi:pilus assembly protein CpaF
MLPTAPSTNALYDFGNYGDFGASAGTSATSPQAAAAAEMQVDGLTQRVHKQTLEHLNLEEVSKLPDDKQRVEIRMVVEHLLDIENPPFNTAQRAQFIQDLLDEIVGLGPLEKLLRDTGLTDILVNGPNQVYVERRGQLEESSIHFRDEQHLLDIIQRIVGRVGRRVDQLSPIVDARLQDGSRVNAVIPPLSLRGATLSIRRFGVTPLLLKDLLRLKALAPEMALFLEAAVKSRVSMIISGGTGSGKTTLLNALSAFIPNNERIISVEDAAELQLQQRHVVQLESRPPNIEGKGAVTMRDLVRNTLRMRPNRIIVGECRGPETFDMLQAMNTGHEGSLTTLHANSPRDALSRVEMMLMMGGMDIPLSALREQIASAIHLIVQADRLPGGPRRITSITEVTGRERDTITTQEIFHFRQLGMQSTGIAHGQFEVTGVRPALMSRIEEAGIALPPDLFEERVLMEA